MLTHRLTLHVFVAVLSICVVVFNIFQAEEVRADEFAQGSLIAELFQPDNEVITSETLTPSPSSYVNTSASIKFTPGIDTDFTTENEQLVVTEGAGALVKQNIIGEELAKNEKAILQYTVQGGDTLSTIASQFNISVATIQWTNNLSEESVIRPGDALYILPTSGVSYTVESGDTVSSIAQKFEANTDEIIEYNDLITGENLLAGKEIIIPGGKKELPQAPQPATQLGSIRNLFTTGGGTPPPNAAVTGTKLQWPTTTRRISQYFRYGHAGVDIDGEFADPIYAAEGGKVVTAGWYGGYGLHVVIDHGNGLQTLYAHLQKVFVSEGQSVGRGQSLGEEGSTGRSSGSHLHFEVRQNGRAQNPFSYF